MFFFKSPLRRRRDRNKFCGYRRSITGLTPLRSIETVRERAKYGDSVTVNKESLVGVFSSILLLKTSLTTLSVPAQFQGYLGSVRDLFL